MTDVKPATPHGLAQTAPAAGLQAADPRRRPARLATAPSLDSVGDAAEEAAGASYSDTAVGDAQPDSAQEYVACQVQFALGKGLPSCTCRGLIAASTPKKVLKCITVRR